MLSVANNTVNIQDDNNLRFMAKSSRFVDGEIEDMQPIPSPADG